MLCVGASPKFIAFAGATTAPALAVQLSLFFLLIVVNRLGASCRDPVIAVESWARHRRLVSLGGIVVILAVVTVLWPVWGSRAGVAVIAIVLAVDAFTLGFRSPFSRAVCAWVLWWDYMKTTALVVVSCVMLGPLALLGLVRLPRVIRRLAWTLRFVSRWRRRHIRIAKSQVPILFLSSRDDELCCRASEAARWTRRWPCEGCRYPRRAGCVGRRP